MLSRLLRALVIVALCVSVGGYWAALQSVAWATMIVTNAEHESLVKAVADTFDGQHPCALCKRIAAAKHSQKENKTAQPAARVDLFHVHAAIMLLPPGWDFRFETSAARAFERAQSPPTPPPRAGLI